MNRPERGWRQPAAHPRELPKPASGGRENTWEGTEIARETWWSTASCLWPTSLGSLEYSASQVEKPNSITSSEQRRRTNKSRLTATRPWRRQRAAKRSSLSPSPQSPKTCEKLRLISLSPVIILLWVPGNLKASDLASSWLLKRTGGIRSGWVCATLVHHQSGRGPRGEENGARSARGNHVPIPLGAGYAIPIVDIRHRTSGDNEWPRRWTPNPKLAGRHAAIRLTEREKSDGQQQYEGGCIGEDMRWGGSQHGGPSRSHDDRHRRPHPDGTQVPLPEARRLAWSVLAHALNMLDLDEEVTLIVESIDCGLIVQEADRLERESKSFRNDTTDDGND